LILRSAHATTATTPATTPTTALAFLERYGIRG
jgi:hypothetical protein